MNKRLKFLVPLILIWTASVGLLCVPAASFTNDVDTSTGNMLLINLDTHTTVYSQKPDTKCSSGGLAELMTFLLSCEQIQNPEEVSYKVEQSFIDDLPYSDGSLDAFVGKTVTAADLMEIMLLTSGGDAAYALCDLSTDGDRVAFVDAMNARAKKLGMTKTTYLHPGHNDDKSQTTTCRDVYRLYMAVSKLDRFHSVMEDITFVPKGLEGKKYTVTTNASILNEKSPYYFRYTNDAKYSYTESTRANLVCTTTYRGMSYIFIGLGGVNESERNPFADARKLTTWAYLNLSDRKVIDSDDAISSVPVDAGWGTYDMKLVALSSAYKTLPDDYDPQLLEYTLKVPDQLSLPLFEGQTIGSAKIEYDNERIDEVELAASSDEGVEMLSDFGRYSSFVFDRLMPVDPRASAADDDVLLSDTEEGT